MPDLFRGDPVPLDSMGDRVPGFNMTAWSARHPPSQIEEVIDVAVEAIRGDLHVSKVGAVVCQWIREILFIMLIRYSGILFRRQICCSLFGGRKGS